MLQANVLQQHAKGLVAPSLTCSKQSSSVPHDRRTVSETASELLFHAYPHKRGILTECLPGVAAPWARKTAQLSERLTAVDLALGGTAGGRLGRSIGLATSRNTLMRLIRRAPLPPNATPAALGVGDWALRKLTRCRSLTASTCCRAWPRHLSWRSPVMPGSCGTLSRPSGKMRGRKIARFSLTRRRPSGSCGHGRSSPGVAYGDATAGLGPLPPCLDASGRGEASVTCGGGTGSPVGPPLLNLPKPRDRPPVKLPLGHRSSRMRAR